MSVYQTEIPHFGDVAFAINTPINTWIEPIKNIFYYSRDGDLKI